MSNALAPSIERRHDLDALRAIAMLLGIALHGMISFLPSTGGGWAVQDTQTSGSFAIAIAAIHGFRMPLFFMISGFFTMMLLRKRGMKALLKQRFKRIFLPFILSMLTIIPAVWAVSIYVSMMAKRADAALVEADAGPVTGPAVSGWVMAASGDVDGLKGWLEAGGDVLHREEDGSTALHGAFLFGRADTAQMLMDAGADPEAANERGESCIDMLSAPWGITQWVAGLVNVPADQDDVLGGRVVIAERLKLPQASELANAKPSDGAIRLLLFDFPVTGHLWFLWFLCWLVAGFSICVSIGRKFGIPPPPHRLSSSSIRYAWLIPLTMIPQALMRGDGMGFGPDTSIGLLPMPVVLAYYAVFFGFGALYFDATGGARDAEPSGIRGWITVLFSLLVLFPVGLAINSQHDRIGPWASVLIQASYAWLMTFGLMGIFSRVLSRESRVMRYLSDASYWLYLAHIPLIIAVQYWVRDWPLSAFVKFPIVCVVTSTVLLVSYQLFIRYTPIGTLLNGKHFRGESTGGAVHSALAPIRSEDGSLLSDPHRPAV
jgi:peptidoglycan/LPS O-acetylase OafA/YrhL